MSNKKCLVYETLGNISDMKIVEGKANDGCVRLTGVFGVCGIKNGNNRIYNKENYGKMVENLQGVIMDSGCLGELEHPNSMNINLENVSHKIESIEMNEDGTITGTIRLLNTPKGQIAQAIIEGGCPLFISSRGAGSIDEAGNVTLSTIKTYDLVGTPGFSQAKLNLKENQTLESLNENLAIVFESDDLLGGDESDKEDDSKDEKEDDSKEDDSKDEKEDDSKEDDSKDKEENNKDIKDKVTMEEIKKAIDALTDKVTSLEAELHVAQESLAELEPVNYNGIEKWLNEEFATTLKDEIYESVTNDLNKTIEEAIENNTQAIAEGVENWINKEYTNNISESIQKSIKSYINEEYSEQIQNWITEEFAPEIQNWITEEYTPEIGNWITEEYSTTIENWINEEFAVAQKEDILNEAYENVNMFIESKKEEKLDFIDKMLEGIDNLDSSTALDKLVKEQEETNKFKGVYVVENMPSQYAPVWAGLSESKQQEIIRSSRMYDFTKEGVLESFWANADLSEKQVITESKTVDVVNNYHNTVADQMRRFGKWS
jgi:hypothetical protein